MCIENMSMCLRFHLSLKKKTIHNNNRLCLLCLCLLVACFITFTSSINLNLNALWTVSQKHTHTHKHCQRTRNYFKDFRFIRLIIWGIRNETKRTKEKKHKPVISRQNLCNVIFYLQIYILGLSQVNISSSLCPALSFFGEPCVVHWFLEE